MRPKASRRTSTSSAVARAKMLLKAKLWWREGFPSGPPTAAGLPWTVVAGPGRENTQLLLTRRELSGATHALKKLSGEYRAVLPKLQQDPAAFIASVQALLDALKPAVHRLASPERETLWQRFATRDVRRVSRVAQQFPRLRSLIDAVTWSCVSTPTRLGKMLTVVEANADALAQIANAGEPYSLTAALNLVDLTTELGTPVLALQSILTNAHALSSPTQAENYPERLRQVVLKRYGGKPKIEPPPDRPAARLGAQLHEWTQWVAAQDPATRRRALKCFALLGTQELLGDWADWWRGLERTEAQLRKQLPAHAVRADALNKLERRVRRAAEQTPAPISAGGLTSLLRWYASVAEPKFVEEACATLGALGDSRLASPFLEHFKGLYLSCGAKFARRGVVALRAYFVATADLGDARLEPWADVLKQWRAGNRLPRYGFEEELLLEKPGTRRVEALYAALAHAARTAAATDDVADSLVELAPCELPVAAAAEIALGLSDPKLKEHYFESETLRHAVGLTDGQPRAALSLLQSLATLESGEDRRFALRALDALQKSELLSLGLCLVADGHVQRLSECGRLAKYLRMPIAPQPLAQGDVAWATQYPAPLHAALSELSASDPDAEHSAHRVLKQHFPKREEVQRQIAALESKLQREQAPRAQSLHVRLSNLRARLAKPSELSARRLEHLAADLRRAARQAVLRRLEQETVGRATAVFESLLGTSPLPDWLLQPSTLRLILPALELPKGFKELALQILRARAGPPPWDLREAPANAAFLERLRERGVDTAEWLDSALRIHVELDAEPVELALETDPLQVLEMGAHFNTCLSPGSFNYFSTFANAADVNKRVMYARDAKGRVLGRCLMALTESGGLLTFHPYAHSNALRFHERAAQFAQELAARMGISPVASGEVTLLLAPDWYDDGPRDLCKRFAFLEKDSPFRKTLGTRGVDGFVEDLKERFAPLALNELTLPLVLELPELAENPELVRPLLPLLANLEALPGLAAVSAARLTLALGERKLAKRLFAKRIEQYALWYMRRHNHFESRAAELLIHLEPRLTLRLLRLTRPRGVRGWAQEFEFHRFELAARAYEALHRPNKAIELYRQAEGSSLPKQLRDQCSERVRALEQQLGRV